MLELLRCPVTKQPLNAAPERLAESLRKRRETLRNRDGEIPEPFESGLVTVDGAWFYPVRQTIPVLLPGEAIGLL